ncbi:hypothetical protein TNCV_2884151 [Trichonephila clavipes]|nr:hypothetical protein TNCV_2884151 [Trichonephila clavipes]
MMDVDSREVINGTSAMVSDLSVDSERHKGVLLQIEAHEIHYGKRLDVRLSLAVALNTIQVTVRFSSAPPQFGGSGASHLSSPTTNLTRGLSACRLFKVPPCREGTMHLQTSVSSPGFEPRPYGTAVSIANHYTWWATEWAMKTYRVQRGRYTLNLYRGSKSSRSG